MNEIQYRAEKEHAWLLRAEGLKLREIAVRLGVNRETARQKVKFFSRRMNRAMRHTRFHVDK